MKDKIKIEKKDFPMIRKSWPTPDFDPSTKIERVKTDYKRSNTKKEIQDALDEMEQDQQLDI